MIQIIKRAVFLLFGISFLAACSQESRQQFMPTPNAYGPRNQLVVVADDETWEGAIGDTIRFYYGSAYPILPQPEPIFDLTHFTPQEVLEDPLRKQLRHLLFVANIADADSPTTRMVTKDLGAEKIRAAREDVNSSTTVAKDLWAKNQLLIYIYGNGESTVKDQLIKTFPAAKRRLAASNAIRIRDNAYVSGENKTVMETLREELGVQMRIPKTYIVAYNQDQTVWLRDETPVSSSNIMIHKRPYVSQSQLSRESLKSIQDSLGKKLVSTDIDGTYMRINDVALPMFVERTELNDNYALEARGIWDMVNDYAGGPFVSYLTINPKTNELVYVNGFVHAPGEDKREFMQNLEYVISTMDF